MTKQLSFGGFPERVDGMERAKKHADTAAPDWSDRAYAALERFTQTVGGPFLSEHFVKWTREFADLDQPPDNRAWGAVIHRGSRHGLIRNTGRFQLDSFASPKPLWERTR